jgi:hypothetical protein
MSLITPVLTFALFSETIDACLGWGNRSEKFYWITMTVNTVALTVIEVTRLLIK